MPLKLLAFCTAMLFSTSVFAQQVQPAGEAVGDVTPQETELLEMAGKLVSYGRESKSALPLIQAVQIFRQLNVVDDTENKDQATSYESQLLADAEKYADGNKTLLNLINDTKRTARAGGIDGPKRYLAFALPNQSVKRTLWFQGGKFVQIVLDGQSERLKKRDKEGNLQTADLRLVVYDRFNNIIAEDQSKGVNCVVNFIPRMSANLTIEVKNVGKLEDNYALYIYSN